KPGHHKCKWMPHFGAATNATLSYRFIQRDLWMKRSVQLAAAYLWNSAVLSVASWGFSSLMRELQGSTGLACATGGTLHAAACLGSRKSATTVHDAITRQEPAISPR